MSSDQDGRSPAARLLKELGSITREVEIKLLIFGRCNASSVQVVRELLAGTFSVQK